MGKGTAPERMDRMTTKAQERKALEQIRKIVEALGEDSYIGTAFEGCFEIAEDNIEFDFALSMKDKVQSAENRLRGQTKRNEELEKELKELMKRAEEAEKLFNAKTASADNWCAKYHEANDMAIANWNKFREQEDRADALEAEIIKLKAKLYDLMTA